MICHKIKSLEKAKILICICYEIYQCSAVSLLPLILKEEIKSVKKVYLDKKMWKKRSTLKLLQQKKGIH